MAKWAIVEASSGGLSDICDEADKFEIYEGADSNMKWVEVPDDTTYSHYMANGTIYDSADDQDSVVEAMLNRTEAYGPVGDQLDMMYRDQVNSTNEWRTHINNVKTNTAKPSTVTQTKSNDPKRIQLQGRKAWDPWVDNWVPPG
tara:strand:+ start:4087 stop:4518 length:432 start_codon:yes stop_codon:yes gene_type:complete